MIRLLFVVLLALGFSACTDSSSQDQSQLDWSHILETPDNASQNPDSYIHIDFLKKYVLKEGVSQDELVSISPEPSTYRTIFNRNEKENSAIVLSGDFEHGKRYTFTLHADKIEGLPKQYKTYTFTKSMDDISYEIIVNGFSTSSKDDNTLNFSGELRFNGDKKLADVKHMVKASVDAQEVPLSWSEVERGRRFVFSIKGLEKKEKNQDLVLQWYQNSGDKEPKSEHFSVPAIAEFSVENVHVEKDQSIKVTFTQKLDKKSKFKNLVGVKGLLIAKIKVVDNVMTIIPSRHSYAEHTLLIHKMIKSQSGLRLKETYTTQITFERRKPSVKFVGKGVILPHAEHLEVPIEVTNVKSVHLRAFQVYKNNMGQFLQENRLKGSSNLKRVGRFLWDKKIEIKDAYANSKMNYSLDVTKLLENEDGALIRLTLYIDRGDSLYECTAAQNAIPVKPMAPFVDLDDADFRENGGWDAYESYYEREQKEDPCSDTYYEKNTLAKSVKNLLKSDIGIIAKSDANREKLYVALSALETTDAISGASVRVYNFQDQVIGTATSDKEGMCEIKVSGVSYYLRAKKGKAVGYLKLSPGLSLPLSQFDVSGTHIKQNLNGFIYGERDVWRPGDKIFLTFVLDDALKTLPENYPVKMELIDPSGNVISSKVNTQPTGALYAFEMQTPAEAVTGKWKAMVSVGNQKFSKDLAIETVVPNRLKVELTLNKKVLRNNDDSLKGSIFAQWLHGAKASNLKTEVSVKTRAKATRLGRFEDYTFDDITRKFSGSSASLFRGTLDEEGKVDFPLNFSVQGEPSGMLRASFTTKVFEEGGAFSANTQSFDFHPYNQYVGLKLPKGDATRGMILTDKDHKVKVAVLDTEGKPVANSAVTVSLYKINWRWWWDKGSESLARYSGSNSHDLVSSGTVKSSAQGQATWKLRVNYPEWGRYLVRACSDESKHCSSKIVYIDWPGWAGRAVEQKSGGVARLTLASDKSKYTVGETAVVTLPKSKNSRVLVSLENGEDVIKQYWVSSQTTTLKIPITEEMAPNVYVSVSLIQPHKERENDKAIRLMGILNLMVDNPKSHLTPELSLPKEVVPGKNFTIEVNEKSGRAMDYSLVIVDEGLLGLTNYQTPSLHNYFYKRKGLQVKTWDLYDDVVGAYSGELERMLDVGGSDSAKEEERNKKRRFKPVVKYLGTFSLAAGEHVTHEVTMPQYIGAVRVMLVAAKDRSYGKADGSILVRSPLSLLATLPRALNIHERISLPVDLFVMKEGIKNVKVKVDAESDYFETLVGEQTLHFKGQGEEIAELELKTKGKIGKAKVVLTAVGGGKKATKTIYIDIKAPNPETFRSEVRVIRAGEAWKNHFVPHGMKGTNKTTLELSSVPPLNLESRLHTLVTYPHGCIEQTTSSVFAQLYLSDIMRLDAQQKKEVDKNIAAAIERLRSFQVRGGGLSYWPNQQSVHAWGSVYALHFLLEAKRKGYYVPSELLTPLVDYEVKEAKKVLVSKGAFIKTQAYRLYLLTLAKHVDMSAMYRLKEEKSIDNVSRWILAAAYYNVGQKEVAESLMHSQKIARVKDLVNDETFASDLREKALMLMSATTLKDADFSFKLAKEISKTLNSDAALNTQSMGFSLMAMGRFAKVSQASKVEVTVDGKKSVIDFDKAIYQKELSDVKLTGSDVSVKNLSKYPVYVVLGNRGVAKEGQEKDASHTLTMDVHYYTMDGKPIDVKELKQGQNFEVEISVSHHAKTTLKNIAVVYTVASGWQILNERVEGGTTSLDFDYQDIRDTQVMTYMSIAPGVTKNIHLRLNASFTGAFYLPAVSAESMYDNKIRAVKKGMKVVVTK